MNQGLTPHFQFCVLTRSQTAQRHGLPTSPLPSSSPNDYKEQRVPDKMQDSKARRHFPRFS